MKQTLYRFLSGTLRGHLIVGVAVVHAIMMALFITDLTARQRTMLLDRQIEEATALSLALATSAAGWIAANDIAGLQELVEAQRRYPEILFAILADQEGRVLADTDTSRQGLYMLDLPGEARQAVLVSTPALVDVVAPAMIRGHQVGWVRVGIGQKQAGEKLAAITRDGIVYALAAILIGSAIAWLMGRRITRRLYAVQKTIAAVRSGNRLARASLSGTDEAAAIAQDFNQMLDVIVERDAELREKTEELDHYFTEALDLLCIADTGGYFRRLNPAWEATLGFPVSELEGRRFLDFIHPDDMEATLQAVGRLADQKEVSNFVNRYRHINGEYRWIEWRAIPTGQRIYAVARDITERKLVEDALRQSEENLHRAQAVAQTGSWYLDIRHNKLTWSAETYRLFGIPQEQPLSLETFAACIHPEDRARVLQAWDAALRGGPYDIEHRIFADNEIRWMRERAEIHFDAAGNPLTGVGTVQDISERKQAEQDIALLSFALNNVHEAAFLIDENARFQYINEEACRILGYSRDELLDLSVPDVDPDFPPERWPDHWNKLRRLNSFTFEGCHKNREGCIFPVEINANYFEYGGQGYNLAMVRDITERKQAEEALRQSEEFNRNILATVDEGFIVVDREYRILSANRAFCDMMQLSAEQMVGRLCYEASHHTARPCFEQDGESRDCAVRHTFETGMPHVASHTHEDASGAKHYMELRSFPVFDASGTVVSAIETINDVTEKRKLEEQLRQSQKMEAVGTLAGGVAHDFNNMLMVIIGHAELALRQIAPDQPLFANLQEIRKAAGRSADLTRQLLTFARKQTVVPKVLDLNETVEGMLKMLRRLIGENINLAWQPGAEIWPVKVDPSQIDQILANLCVNARDAIAGVGKVTIETRNTIIDEIYCADHPEAVPGEYIMLTVSDDGCGMDKQTLDKIFEPFFTTKEMGKGTGLGLATVYGIAKQNNGFVNVYSEPGQGSTFNIYLPRHAGKKEEMPRKSPASPMAGGHETILLAEDEAAILEMVKQILEDFGYRVLAASTPGEALRVAKEYTGEIHLLITDMVMPEMNGHELAKNVLSLYPKLKCLYMSGYNANVVARHGVLAEGIHFIQKPFSMQAFVAKVREAIDSK
ncbi:MAG: PAS domain S-box protein [Desulfobulbia bacterium]